MRELQATGYIASQYKDENLLYNAKVIDPVRLQKGLTYLWGKDSDMFPLLTSTQGAGVIDYKKPKQKLNDTQYTWPVMGRMKWTSECLGLVDSGLTKPGLGHTPFKVRFKDDWLIEQYGITSPDHNHILRIQDRPQKQTNGEYHVEVVIQGSDINEYVATTNFASGSYWSMTAPTVSASKSLGNRSNTMTPGEMTNQYGYFRFSDEIAGNIANKVINIELDGVDANGKEIKSTTWMPFQMKQFETNKRIMLEENLWYSKYNRNAQGQILNKDKENGEPIPTGAGVKEILTTAGGYSTYSTLTLSKFDSIITRLYDSRVDNTPMEIICYTGIGGMKQFNQAIKTVANANSYYQRLGEMEIKEYVSRTGNKGLVYGSYFAAYKTIQGHTIIMKTTNLFDHGSRAQQDRMNNRMIDGLPLESYNMVFLDQSRTNDGGNNITYVCEEGREEIKGIYKGLSPLPGAWGSFNYGNMIVDKRDVAGLEVMVSQGINITNPFTSFWMERTI